MSALGRPGEVESPVATRAAALDALERAPFDLLVIGGGITGAGVARDAALRGLAVALVERDDFASGTSSRSSRLIHGGLRYLEHGHLRLVFESSIERRRLLRLAPHLVRPLQFTWPVYEGARVSKWTLAAGLTLYDALALFRNVGGHERLSAAEVRRREPMLRAEGLTGGSSYYDAATDDTRLTLANALGAASAGAVVVNHADARAIVRADGRAIGADVVDALTGRELRVRARIVVNATGPWSDAVRRMTDPAAQASVRGSKGVHVAIPIERLGNRGALTLLSPADGRVMFVLPGETHTILGTTETETTAAPDQVRATEDDVAYLLRSAGAFFPTARLTRDDVISAWAGIRPLVAAGYGRAANSASREHAVGRDAAGVIAVSGGKLTTYRIMAADVVNAAERALGMRPRPTPTADAPLFEGGEPLLREERALAGASAPDAAVAERLVNAYGSAWEDVWALAERDPSLRARLEPELPYIGAELAYAARHEMACTLADLLMRRTHTAYETRDQGRAAAGRAAEIVGPILAWDAAESARQVERYAREAERVFGIDP